MKIGNNIKRCHPSLLNHDSITLRRIGNVRDVLKEESIENIIMLHNSLRAYSHTNSKNIKKELNFLIRH